MPGKTQPQYLIVANSRCVTHPIGHKAVYTGPRSNVAKGWTILRRVS